MNLREQAEAWEREYLSPFACLSAETRGRERAEEPCDIRPDFQRDRDRIIHCKAFRRLKHKTQVFLAPEGDHYRTRLTHTLEVSQIARTVARALRLNESLTEAIAMGHDLGHTPFGHTGEYILNEIHPGGFTHSEQSVRVVEVLEKKGAGLNLTWEVRDGIRNHGSERNPATLEGHIVRFADKIAYINHDIDDAIRAKIFVESDLPREYTDILGDSVRVRLDNMIHDLINNSADNSEIRMSPEMFKAMRGLRSWMFENVYKNPIAKSEEERARQMIGLLYDYYIRHIEELPDEYLMFLERGDDEHRIVCDYIAGMTDLYAIDRFTALFVPKTWKA